MGIERRLHYCTGTPVYPGRTPPRGIEEREGGHATKAKYVGLHYCQVLPRFHPSKLPRQGVGEGRSRNTVGMVEGQPHSSRRPDGLQERNERYRRYRTGGRQSVGCLGREEASRHAANRCIRCI